MENKRFFSVGLAILVTAVMVFSIFGTINVAPTSIDGESQYLLAHFTELPSAETRARIEATGVTIINYQGDGNYLVKVPGTFSRESMLGILSDNIAVYPESVKVSSELDGMTGIVPLRVSLHQGENVDSVVTVLTSKGATIDKVHDILAPYILCNIDASNIQGIAALNQVSAIHTNPEPETYMDLITSNTYMGHDAAQAGGFTGSGMLAQVQDNGIDRTHPDLSNVDWTDGTVAIQAHGTCTSGIVFGTGGGDIRAQGIAYGTMNSFASWSTGRTISVQNLWNGDFNEGMAGRNGIVQSNSWSIGDCDGLYVATTAEDDAAIVAYPKVLTLWASANSNDGTAEGMISEDSANKNGMCIGAIWHQDTAVMTDDRYEDGGIGNTPSRGPAADGRQKPDMCGNFDHIYTVDATVYTSDSKAEGYVTGSNYYANFGGTSGATPEVAGSSVLAYEMYKENYFGNNPTNAIPYSSTVKALMIADAFQYPLTGTYSATRTCQGWGTPDMEKMYNLGAIYHQFDEYPQAMSSGSTWTRQVYADAVNPLKITLCWIDPAAPSTTNAARALRNNLDLKVTSPGGVIYYGNNGLWDSLYSASGTVVNHWSLSASYRDDLNNVENVFLQTPETGIWTIEVSGRTGDIALGPQHFSLVSSGAMIPVPSKGTIDIENNVYAREATVMIEVQDRDLNTVTTTVQTVNVNLKSVAEPAGETTLLTETGVDTGIFRGTKTISATNSVGVLLVNAVDTITATYNDANDGTGSPAVVTDTATVDGNPPAARTAMTVARYGEGTIPGIATLTTAGTTAAGGPHNVWFTIVDSNAGTELTTPNSVAEFTDAYYTAASTSNDVRAGPSTAPPVFTYEFLKCQFATTVSPSTVNNITLTFEGYFSAALTATMFAWNGATSTWDSLGTQALLTTDTTMTRTITTNPGNYISGGVVLWGVYGDNARRSCTVDFLQVSINYEVPYTTVNDNTINWTHNGVDVGTYNIYRALVAGGPWTTLAGAVPVGTNTYQDNGKGAGDAIYWWYVVRAVDPAGNEEQNVLSVVEPGVVTDSPPTVAVSAPNGGESYIKDSTITITWTATDDKAWPSPSCWIYYDTDTNPTGQILITSAVAASTGTYNWNSVGVAAGNYYIHIVVQDSAAQQTQDWSNGYFSIVVPPYSIDLTGKPAVGWVFVSFPIDISGNIEAILDDADTSWNVAKWFDAQTKTWKTYRPTGTQSFSTINNQMGVWLHLTSNGDDELLTTSVGGNYPVTTDIQLYAGWNMVGYPSATPCDADLTLPDEATFVSVWQTASPYIMDKPKADVTMSEGNAYWVFVTADCTWTVDP